MFRRKGEDSLFDTDQTDTAQGSADTTASTSSSTSSSSAPASSASTASSAPASTPASSSPISTPASSFASNPIPRSAPEPRTAPAPAASGFRPSSSAMGSDMGRSRMPETKVNSSPSIGVGVEKSNKSGRRVLTVGNDILLKGEIATCDRLVIEGKVDATLNDVHTVEIAETGSFKGSANIEDAEISGLFEGDLVVRNRLVIYATGKVRGKISYGEIEIERGGEMTGEIKTTNPQSTTTSPRPTRKVDDKVAA